MQEEKHPNALIKINFFTILNRKRFIMGAIKPNNYSATEVKLSLIARALAHPARVQMIKILRKTFVYRNVDFVQSLQLSKPTIADHLQKLKDADLVEITYLPHCYAISLKEHALNDLSGFITDWD